mgnify:CR=1 FL=1
MNAILALLGGKLGLLAAGAGAALVLALGKKLIPNLVSKLVTNQLGKLLNPKTDDPKEKELIQNLVLALVRLAEYKLPDTGLGPNRKKAVLDALAKIGLGKHADKIEELLEIAVKELDASLKKASS